MAVAVSVQATLPVVHQRSELLGVQALRTSSVATFVVGLVFKT